MAGEIARQMAAAVKPEPKENAKDPQLAALHKVFQLVGFKPVTKADTYKQTDGATSKKIATALIQVGDSAIRFTCNVNYKVTAEGDTGVVCTLPSKKAGMTAFQRIFTSDDPETLGAMDRWVIDIAAKYTDWHEKNKPAAPISSSRAGMVSFKL